MVGYRARIWHRSRWRSAAATAGLIAVAGGIVLTLVAGASRTSSAPDRYVAARPVSYDALVQGSLRADEVANLPAVADVKTVTFVLGELTTAGSDEPIDLFVFAGDIVALGGTLVDGRLPRPGEPGEFVADADAVGPAGLTIGDRLTLRTFSTAQAETLGFDSPVPEGPTLAATLVGTVTNGAQNLDAGTPVAVFGPELLDAGDVGFSATLAVVELMPGAGLEDLRKQVDGLPDGGAINMSPVEVVGSDVRAAVSTQAGGVAVLAAVVAGAVVLVLAQLLARSHRLTPDERADLRAIGARRTQLRVEPVARAAPAVLAGMVGAAVIAYAASDRFPVGFSRVTEPDPGRRLDVLVHVGGAALGAVVLLALLGAFATVGRGAPLEAPSPVVDRVVGALPGVRLATAIRFSFGRGARSGTTTRSLGGVVLLLCLVVAGLTVGASIDRLLDQPARYGQNYDIGVGQGGEVSDEAIQQLAADPAVDTLTRYGATTVSVGERSVGVVGMEPVVDDLLPEVLEGRLPVADDEAALGARLARQLGIGPGDVLDITAAAGALDLHITGIALFPGIEEVDIGGDAALVTASGLLRMDPTDGLTAATVALVDDAPEGTAARLSELTGLQLGGRFNPGVEVLGLDRVRAIPELVAGIVGALSLVAVANLLAMAVRRSRRDFAILRSLGATSSWLRSIRSWQAIVTSVVAAGVALPLGVAIGRVVFRPYADRLGARPDPDVPSLTLAGGLVALLVVATLAALVPTWRTRRVTVDLAAPE